MVGLLDIAPATETVTVRGTPVEVVGISAKGVAALLSRFPDLQTLFSGGELDAGRLFEMGGDIVAAIIAAGCGLPGNKEAEDVASSLGLESQAELIEVIIRQTMPSGVTPFVQKLEALGSVLNMQPTTPQLNAPASSPDTANGKQVDSFATSQ